jgi:hypothetical protein
MDRLTWRPELLPACPNNPWCNSWRPVKRPFQSVAVTSQQDEMWNAAEEGIRLGDASTFMRYVANGAGLPSNCGQRKNRYGNLQI